MSDSEHTPLFQVFTVLHEKITSRWIVGKYFDDGRWMGQYRFMFKGDFGMRHIEYSWSPGRAGFV
jgi:hypothetical protein